MATARLGTASRRGLTFAPFALTETQVESQIKGVCPTRYPVGIWPQLTCGAVPAQSATSAAPRSTSRPRSSARGRRRARSSSRRPSAPSRPRCASTPATLPRSPLTLPSTAQLDAELATAADDAAVKECRDAFAQREAAIEHDIDHEPLEMHLQLGVSYNVSRPAGHAV